VIELKRPNCETVQQILTLSVSNTTTATLPCTGRRP